MLKIISTMIRHLVFLLIIFSSDLQNFFYYGNSLSPDGLTLLSLKSAIDNGSTIFSDWNEKDSDACNWTGIACSNVSGESHVVGISVSDMNISGYIPSELGSLAYLRRINFGGNNFHGPVPDQLFNATSLHSIVLHGNNLSGNLPPGICSLPMLQRLDLSNNRLLGSLPKELRKCGKLQQLNLCGNEFSGEIPAGIFAEMVSLVQLDLSRNSFTGKIPEDIGELKSLSGTLNMSFNNLSGNIPRSLGDLPLTVDFDLRSNKLSGEIPKIGSFSSQGQKAFLNNPLLCGFPLRKSCDDVSVSAESSSGDQSFSPWSDDENAEKGVSFGLIVLISVADVVGVAFIGSVIVLVYWRKQSCHGCSCTRNGKLGGNERGSLCSFPCIFGGFSSGSDSEGESEKGGGGGGEGDLVAIDKGFRIELDELLRASAYVLGKSRLGIVYKVVLGSGVPVAVRRLGEGGEERHKEFVAEIQAIGRVKHPNVVKLRAYYWATDEKLVISDFICNGNLVAALHGRYGQPSLSLSWATRLRIAKGVARGLAYLHECSPRKFVHGNIKPSNILLDNEFQPYISDFGLNRLIEITGNNPSTGGLIGGAFAYMKSLNSEQANNYRAPEARMSNKPTQKWDVYSFGVVLLELLTGKSSELSSAAASTSAEALNLVRWAKKGSEDENPLTDMVDPLLLKEVHAKKEVLSVFHLALACTDEDPEIRPRMKTVSETLEKVRP
nr:PREDICTED: probable inactive leucine-rich repeat receptor-like protein kinase At1g66830 [Daucus carota subsp. sativus]